MPLGFSIVILTKYNLFLHFDFSTFLHNFSDFNNNYRDTECIFAIKQNKVDTS